jgi:putative transposase
VLEATRARHQARVYAYVLMPEHIHLLVNEPPRIVLAQFLKALKQVTSRNLKGRREKFWQDRYYDSNVHGEKARSEVIRYIHRNPVKRGLVAKPEQWPWSSFQLYASGVEGPVEIESQWTAFLRGNRLPEGVRLRESEPSCFPSRKRRGLDGAQPIEGEPEVKQLAGSPAKMNETQPPVGLRSVLSHSSTIKLWMNGARTVGARWMTGPPAASILPSIFALKQR